MKLESACRIERFQFSCVEKIKGFAQTNGVEQEFFISPYKSQVTDFSPIILYVYSDFIKLSALVVVHLLSHEIGLWVRPDLRNQGQGNIVFSAVIEHFFLEERKYRVCARTDSTDTKNASRSMCRIDLSMLLIDYITK